MSVRTGARTLTIGTSSSVVSRLQPIATRNLFVLSNISTGSQNIFLGFGQDAINGIGFKMAPGGYYLESKDEGFTPTSEDIYALADAAGATLGITERVETKDVQ